MSTPFLKIFKKFLIYVKIDIFEPSNLIVLNWRLLEDTTFQPICQHLFRKNLKKFENFLFFYLKVPFFLIFGKFSDLSNIFLFIKTHIFQNLTDSLYLYIIYNIIIFHLYKDKFYELF